jgi:hypothetical protein
MRRIGAPNSVLAAPAKSNRLHGRYFTQEGKGGKQKRCDEEEDQ